MSSPSMTNRLSQIFRKAVEDRVFPGAVAGISYGPPHQRTTTIVSYGTTTYPEYRNKNNLSPKKMSADIFFDLASLTKPLATLLAILSLINSKVIALNDTLPALLADTAIPVPLQKCSLAHLLSHSSGLPAHKPYFTELNKLPSKERLPTIRKWILAEHLACRTGEKTIYSDLGYIILSWIIEKHSKLSLDSFVQQSIFTPLNLANQLFFNPGNRARPKLYAPTENCPWRQKTLSGQVHDDNCYALGGVSGHAGLFGNIKGVLELGIHLLDGWHGRTTHPNYNPTDIKKLTATRLIQNSSWCLGFDTPSLYGSSTGRFFSPQSFGHLGFTGTSIWIDPTIDLVTVLLTNRVHLNRNNNQIKKFRPQFHDTITTILKQRRL